MSKYIMSLDQGTTSSRCIIFDHNSQIISIAAEEFTQYYPHPGWVEHNPDDIFNSELNVIKKAMASIGAIPSDIESIGITNQRETTIVWDRHTGVPIYNAIVWQCRRTSDRIDKIKHDGLGDYITDHTGLIADAYFSASKIEWILDNVEGAREKAMQGDLAFGTVDTWLMWKLSDGEIHATDYTNASRTMLFDIHSLQWDELLLKTFNIPKNMLPDVHPSIYMYGLAKHGLNIPITGVAGDQQAALFGQCCFEKGMAKNTYGTGCFLLMNTGSTAVASANGLLTTIAASSDNSISYALEGSVFIAGAAIQWLRDELHMITSASETQDIALSVNDSNGMYIVPAFTGLGTPHWNPYARGSIFGLTRGVTNAHFVRAVLESLAYQTYDLLNAMQLDSGITLKQLKVDGGASNNDFLMQFQADILKTPVIRPEVTETTALGAAYLAGLCTGYFKNTDEIINNNSINKVYSPQKNNDEITALLYGWQRAVISTKFWADNKYF